MAGHAKQSWTTGPPSLPSLIGLVLKEMFLSIIRGTSNVKVMSIIECGVLIYC